jgi:hypothetical protein
MKQSEPVFTRHAPMIVAIMLVCGFAGYASVKTLLPVVSWVIAQPVGWIASLSEPRQESTQPDQHLPLL